LIIDLDVGSAAGCEVAAERHRNIGVPADAAAVTVLDVASQRRRRNVACGYANRGISTDASACIKDQKFCVAGRSKAVGKVQRNDRVATDTAAAVIIDVVKQRAGGQVAGAYVDLSISTDCSGAEALVISICNSEED